MAVKKMMVLVLVMALAAGVASAAEPVGYWISTGVDLGDGNISEFLDESLSIKDMFHVEFLEDGTCTLVTMGEVSEGKWKSKGDGIEIEFEGANGPTTMEQKDGKLTWGQDEIKYYFDKQSGKMDRDAAVAASAKAAEAM